jgi:glutathione S-transferase
MTVVSRFSFAKLTLYTSTVCPFAQRVTIALFQLGLLKNLDEGKQSDSLDVVHIDLNNKPDWFTRDINPQGKVPALKVKYEDGSSEILVESAPLAELLLQAHDHVAVLNGPDQALARFRSALVTDVLGGQFIGTFYGLLFKKDSAEQDALRAKLLNAVTAVQQHLQPAAGGPFALGTPDLTLTDILWAPFLQRLPVNRALRNFVVPETVEYTRYNEWRQALAAHPAIKATSLPETDLISFYADYASKRAN